MAEKVEINTEKIINIELQTDKNDSYSIEFTLNNSIEIVANQINGIIRKSFSGKFSFEEMKEYKLFSKFQNLDDIFNELKNIIYDNNKIFLKDNGKLLIINFLLSDNYKIPFELIPMNDKNNYLKLSDLTELVIKLNTEVNNLKNDNDKLKKEILDLKDKSNILWKQRNISKIIQGNEEYYKTLENWINPFTKIKAELLYRLSENGYKYSTFHELCDNKGPLLILFHVNDGNIVGIYTPLSLDSNFNWKHDKETFIFNLNKNLKCEKLTANCSIKCDKAYGPWTADFGCGKIGNSMKSIKHYANWINKTYDKGSEILPSNNLIKVYDLIETEIYKIIIE